MPGSSSKDQTVLITGASGGIGFELAKVFAEEGFNLVLTARSEDKLSKLSREIEGQHQVRVTVIKSDLSRNDGVDTLIMNLKTQNLKIDILVNNAGVGLFGKFAELDAEEQIKMIQLNVVSLTDLTRRLLPEMINRNSGRIMNVASTAAFQPGPLMAVYYATKAYVLSFSEALANELQGTGVTVTALCPGPTISGFQAQAGLENSKLFRNRRLPDSKSVARSGYQALMKGKTVHIHGFVNWAMAQSVRLAPRKTVTQVVRKIQEEAGKS